NNSATTKHTSVPKLFHKFDQIQGQILFIYEEIQAHNRFWSKYLTIYFVVYILEVCILTYAALYVPSDIGFQKTFFIFFDVEFFLLLIWVTYECSLTVYNNTVAHRRSQQFYLQLQSVCPLTVDKSLKVYGFYR